MAYSLASACLAFDNVAVFSTLDLPTQLQDDFDPMVISNWLFYPGGQLEVLYTVQ